MFSSAVERALRASLAAHEGQFRKGAGGVPYAVHPFHVALMLARAGLEEDVIVAGLMHDVVEDSPKEWSLARLEREFGAHVGGIVAQLTEDKSKTWEERKREGVARVAHMSPEAASVLAVDKLHNLHSLAAELRSAEDPGAVWARFRGGRERTLALSRELVEALCARIETRLARALRSAHKALVDADAEPRERRLAGRP